MNHQNSRHIKIASTLIVAAALLLGNPGFADSPQFRVAFERVPGTEQIEAGQLRAGIKVLEDQLAQIAVEDSGDLLATLCGAYIVNRSLDKAEPVCDKAIEIDPTKTAYNNRGVLRALTADMSGARDDFNRVRPPQLDVYLDELRTTDVPLVAEDNFYVADKLLSKRTLEEVIRLSEMSAIQ